MTVVRLVKGHDLVSVVPQSEHAMQRSFSTWTEAVAFCKANNYTISNQEVADEACASELAKLEEVLKADLEDQGGEGHDA